MIVEATRDRRAERRESTRAEILDAAWELCRAQGVAGLALRDVARKIGMRPPSLYWYFDSKQAIYDAMFAQGNRELLERLTDQHWPSDPRAILRSAARVFVEFSAEDVERYQLLFQRTVPAFQPSPESYAFAVQVFDQMRARLALAGVSDPAHFDMWTALVAGLSAQQTANDPGGDRWLCLVDEAVDMYADHIIPGTSERRTDDHHDDTGRSRAQDQSRRGDGAGRDGVRPHDRSPAGSYAPRNGSARLSAHCGTSGPWWLTCSAWPKRRHRSASSAAITAPRPSATAAR